MASEPFDVCVIGTGAGGGVMIQELCEAGFRVVALERGPHLSAAQFSDDELSVVVRDELFSPDQLETTRPTADAKAVPGRWNTIAQCVGGTMTHWAAWSWRFRPDELAVLSHEGPVPGADLADWPFSYADLEPFYEKAEWDFGVSGDAAANPFGAPRNKGYPNPPHPMRVATLAFDEGARALGYTPFPLPTAINSQPYRDRPRCLYGGACQMFGCPIHAKATTFSVCIPRAQKTGRLDLRPNAMAREITLGDDGRARSVVYLDREGGEHEVFARHVILAGGAFGSPHLLLMSRSGSFPEGLANSSGLVGRYLTFHVAALVNGYLDRPALGVVGFETHAALDDLHPSDSKRGFIRGGVIGENNIPTRQPLVYTTFGPPGHPRYDRAWGAELKDYLRKFPRAFSVVAVLEDLPMHQNTVDLDPDVVDRWGLPVVRMTHTQHPNDIAMARWYEQRLLEIAEAAGATEKWISKPPGLYIDDEHSMTGSPAHFHGTCRAGNDPGTSVLDRWCRTHDVPNLWVVDGSFFPTSGGYNPTLTILANAYRVADHFIAEAKRQNL